MVGEQNHEDLTGIVESMKLANDLLAFVVKPVRVSPVNTVKPLWRFTTLPTHAISNWTPHRRPARPSARADERQAATSIEPRPGGDAVVQVLAEQPAGRREQSGRATEFVGLPTDTVTVSCARIQALRLHVRPLDREWPVIG